MSRHLKSFFPLKIIKIVYIVNLVLILIAIIALNLIIQMHSHKSGSVEREATFLLLGWGLLLISVMFSRRLFTGFKRDLAMFSEAIASEDPAQFKNSFPELNPIINLVQQRTGDMEKTIQKLVKEIKKRKSVQQKLSKANEKITTIMDSITDAFFTLDNQWRFTYINEEAKRLFLGISGDFKGKSFKEIPDSITLVKTLRESKSKQSKVCIEFYSDILHKWFDVNAYPSKEGLSVYLKDITSRKQAENQIVFQAAVLDQVRNIVVVTDLEGRIIYWNKFAEAACQWTTSESMGKRTLDLIVPAEARCTYREMLKTVISGSHWEGEILVRRKDGSTLPTHTVTTPIKDAHGHIIGVVGVSIDISERKELEKEMIRLDRLDLVGEMAAGIGHEVRNPMTTVRGFLQLLSTRETDSEKREYYELMMQELDRANSIITEYLSLAKNKMVTLKMQSLNSIISHLLPLLQAGAIVADKHVKTELDNIPDLLIDDKEIRQMILNLVRNGIEAMSAGGELTIRTYMDERDVILEVCDQGPGIDPKIIDRLGTPFVTTKDGGTGLGLAVSYSIANRHNVRINYITGPTGTTFFVRFGAAAQQEVADSVVQEAV